MKYGIIDIVNMNMNETYFNLLQVVHRKDHPQQRWGPRLRYYYSVHYIREGETIFIIDDKTYHLKKGDSIIFFPDQVVYFYTVPDTKCDIYWISFNGIVADNIIATTTFSKSNPVIHSEEDISWFYENILKNKGDSPENHLKIIGYMYILFSQYVKKDYREEHRDGNDIYFEKAVAYINENLFDEVNIDHLCETLHLSKSHLYRIFNAKVGMPIKHYINRNRIGKSLNMLRLTDLTIQQISNQLGFNDQLYFTRLFTTYMGISPSQYRKMNLFMGGPIEPTDTEKMFVDKVKVYIEENYKEELSTDMLAEVFQIKKTKLVKKFKFVTKISVSNYILSVRMAKASEMFKNGLGVSEVAEKCGYKDKHYFSRVFSKCYGLNPQNYRKLNMRKDIDPNKKTYANK